MVKLLCVTALIVLTGSSTGHIEENTPDDPQFGQFLKRDIETYFYPSSSEKTRRVDYKLLRKAVTQSGTSYPKFYVWLRIFEQKSLVKEGAARLEVIDKLRFQVTDFLAKEEIKNDPSKIETIFPVLLKSKILSLALKK